MGQDRDGSLPGGQASNVELLRSIVRTSQDVFTGLDAQTQFEMLRADVEDWIANGLHTVPEFGRTRDAFVAPNDGEIAFFVGCALTTNSTPPVGRRMECFLVRRHEPPELDVLTRWYPHPKNICCSVVLLIGSNGLRQGNCIVFFPENVSSSRPMNTQAYALFFFNKFRRIHETFAVPPATRIIRSESMPTASMGLAPDACYRSRSVWGYLHDYYHHQGRWPLDEHVALKTNWFVGLLEETKVDARTVLAVTDNPGLPFRDEQTDMILLERLVRYPRARSATRNFDSGTGVFLYSWFRERGCLYPTTSGLFFDRARSIEALREYVDEVEQMEARVESPESYRVEAISFVRRYLAEGATGDRFTFTSDQQLLLANRDSMEDEHLVFDEAEH